MNHRGVYAGLVTGHQVVSECPGPNVTRELHAAKDPPVSWLDKCRRQRPDDLWDRTFDSVAVTEGGKPRPLVPGTRIELTFEKQRRGVIWGAGCNTHGAGVKITADRLLLGEISGTDVGCSDELLEQDEWLAEFFSSDPLWRLRRRALSCDRLTLTSGDTVIKFEARLTPKPKPRSPRAECSANRLYRWSLQGMTHRPQTSSGSTSDIVWKKQRGRVRDGLIPCRDERSTI